MAADEDAADILISDVLLSLIGPAIRADGLGHIAIDAVGRKRQGPLLGQEGAAEGEQIAEEDAPFVVAKDGPAEVGPARLFAELAGEPDDQLAPQSASHGDALADLADVGQPRPGREDGGR